MPHAEQMPPEREEELLQLLQGGLKGRFARGFSVLQGCVDALERYLSSTLKPPHYAEAAELLERTQRTLSALERLADNTAEVALGAAARGIEPPEEIEMSAYLQSLCAAANRELALRSCPAHLSAEVEGRFYLRAGHAVLNMLFANLISNSVCARHDADIRLRLADGVLAYRDDGPGLTGPQRAVLAGAGRGKAPTDGSTGLLLVSVLAEELGWQITLPPEEGLAVEFCVGASVPAPAGSLSSSEKDDDWRAAQLESCLRREFAAALPRA